MTGTRGLVGWAGGWLDLGVARKGGTGGWGRGSGVGGRGPEEGLGRGEGPGEGALGGGRGKEVPRGGGEEEEEAWLERLDGKAGGRFRKKKKNPKKKVNTISIN